MEIKIFGVGEDFIEIQGDIAEEFMIDVSERLENQYFAFSDGTILCALFKHDRWMISKTHDGTAIYMHRQEDTAVDHNDVVTLIGDLRWVLRGSEVVFSS